ncbi:MAG: helix-turn-helix domain-containing protein [Acidobacteria bacterium]|nr:helix-turn-helix domain-containing protein [Acidobacteriota bacterium]
MDSSSRRERLTETEASIYIGMSRPWMRLARMKRQGPSFLKIGRAIRYDVADLDQWLDSHRVRCA